MPQVSRVSLPQLCPEIRHLRAGASTAAARPAVTDRGWKRRAVGGGAEGGGRDGVGRQEGSEAEAMDAFGDEGRDVNAGDEGTHSYDLPLISRTSDGVVTMDRMGDVQHVGGGSNMAEGREEEGEGGGEGEGERGGDEDGESTLEALLDGRDVMRLRKDDHLGSTLSTVREEGQGARGGMVRGVLRRKNKLHSAAIKLRERRGAGWMRKGMMGEGMVGEGRMGEGMVGEGMIGGEQGGRRMRSRHLQRKKMRKQGFFGQAPFDSPFERRLLQVQAEGLSGEGEGEGSEEGAAGIPRSVREPVRLVEGQAQRVVVFNPLAHEMKRVSERDDLIWNEMR